MRLVLVLVVVFVTAVGEAGLTSDTQYSKHPAVNSPPPSLPSPGFGPGETTPERTFSICYPYECPSYTPLIDKHTRLKLKRFPAAKWLKLRKKSFDPRDINFTAGLNSYATSTGISVAVPVVWKVDVPVDHRQRYTRYVQRWKEIMAQLEQFNNETTSLTSLLFKEQTSSSVVALKRQLQAEYEDCIGNFNATVFNYAHPRYQVDPLVPFADVEELPVPANINLTIVHEPGFTVLPRHFVAVTGIANSYERAVQFSSNVNVPFTTYYMASYLNMNFEIWLGMDPSDVILS